MEFEQIEAVYSKSTRQLNFLIPEIQPILKKREQFAVNLRKQKSRDLVKQKRQKLAQIIDNQNSAQAVYQGVPSWRERNFEPQTEILIEIFGKSGQNISYHDFNMTYSPTDKIQFLTMILDQQFSVTEKLAIFTKIRQELSRSDIMMSELTNIIENTSLITVVVRALDFQVSHQNLQYLKLEGLWILTNIACGQDEDLWQLFTINQNYDFSKTLRSILTPDCDLKIFDQIMFLMGNLTYQRNMSRHIRNNFNLTQIILTVFGGLTKSQQTYYSKNIAWVAHNLCQDARSMEINEVNNLYQILKICLELTKEEQTLFDVTAGLSNLSKVPEATVEGAMPQLIQSLGRKMDLQIVHFLGNLMAQNDVSIAQEAVGLGIIDKMSAILSGEFSSSQLIKEVLWMLSNICANKDLGHQKIFIESATAKEVLKLTMSQYCDVAAEAVWVICNLVTCGTIGDVQMLISHDIVKTLASLLQKDLEAKQLSELLQCLTILLNEGDATIFDKIEIGSILLKLQGHKNPCVYEGANRFEEYLQTFEEFEVDQANPENSVCRALFKI